MALCASTCQFLIGSGGQSLMFWQKWTSQRRSGSATSRWTCWTTRTVTMAPRTWPPSYLNLGRSNGYVAANAA